MRACSVGHAALPASARRDGCSAVRTHSNGIRGSSSRGRVELRLRLREVDVRAGAADAQRLRVVRARGVLLAVVVPQRHLRAEVVWF